MGISETQIKSYMANVKGGTKAEGHCYEPLFQLALCEMALRSREADLWKAFAQSLNREDKDISQDEIIKAQVALDEAGLWPKEESNDKK